MKKEQPCRTTLLDDTPAATDHLGPHARIAATIAQMIQEEPSGRCVGLEGDWGSGKSTVVNLVRGLLSSDEHVRVVVFDAWAHQGDPLRRAFLEHLHTQLGDTPSWLSDSNGWTNKFEFLSGKKSESETRTDPILTRRGLFLALSLLLTPIALTAARLNSTFLGLDVASNIAIPLAAIPFILMVSFLLHGKWRTCRATGKGAEVDHNADLFGILMNKIVTEQKTCTVESGEPTSIEFESVFSELLKDALQPNRRLVLVVDNLDRVATSDALRVWATLQAFVHPSDHRQGDWVRRLWVLVPFSAQGLRRLWATGSPEVAQGSSNQSTEVETWRSFIDKAFAIRLRVPAPVMSDWHQYFLKVMKEVLPDHSDADFFDCHRVYSLFVDKKPPPTPRQMKLVANQVGILHRQWGHVIPLSHMTYFALLSASGLPIDAGLRKPGQSDGLPDPKISAALGTSLSDNLAALWFGVDAEHARQELLQGPIVDALGRGDGERLAELARVVGFWEVLGPVVEVEFGNPQGGDTRRFFMAVAALLDADLVDLPNTPTSAVVLDRMVAAVQSLDALSPFDEVAGKALAGLIAKAGTRIDAKRLLRLIQAFSIESVAAKEDAIEQWLRALHLVLTALESAGRQADYSGGLRVPGDAMQFIVVCEKLEMLGFSKKFFGLLRPEADAASIEAAFRQHVNDQKYTATTIDFLQVMLDSQVGPPMDRLATILGTRLTSAPFIPDFSVLVEGLFMLRTHGSLIAKQKLAEVAKSGHAFTNVSPQANTVSQDSMAWAALLVIEGNPNLAGNVKHIQRALGQPARHQVDPVEQGGIKALTSALSSLTVDLVEKFLKNAKAYSEAKYVWDGKATSPAIQAFADHCFRFSASRGDSWLFTEERVFAHWQMLVTVFTDKGMVGLLKKLMRDSTFLQTTCRRPFAVDQAGFHGYLLQAGAASSVEYRDWLSAALRQITKPTWNAQLATPGALVDLVVGAVNTGVPVNLEAAFEDALVDHARTAIAGKLDNSPDAGSWRKLPEALNGEPERKTLRTKLAELAALETSIAPVFWELYGAEIREVDVWVPLAKEFRNLAEHAVEKLDPVSLAQVVGILKQGAGLDDALRELPGHLVDDLQRRIRKALRDEKALGDAAGPIRDLASILGTDGDLPTGER